MDKEDIELWKNFQKICEDAKLKKLSFEEFTKQKTFIYGYFLDKYGILINRQFYVDPVKNIILNLNG